MPHPGEFGISQNKLDAHHFYCVSLGFLSLPDEPGADKPSQALNRVDVQTALRCSDFVTRLVFRVTESLVMAVSAAPFRTFRSP